jgi:hypothetical protein
VLGPSCSVKYIVTGHEVGLEDYGRDSTRDRRAVVEALAGHLPILFSSGRVRAEHRKYELVPSSKSIRNGTIARTLARHRSHAVARPLSHRKSATELLRRFSRLLSDLSERPGQMNMSDATPWLLLKVSHAPTPTEDGRMCAAHPAARVRWLPAGIKAFRSIQASSLSLSLDLFHRLLPMDLSPWFGL